VPEAASVAVTVSPAQASIGSPVEMHYRFEALPGADLPKEPRVVFVHAVDGSGRQVWTDDHALPVPVAQWKARMPIEYTRVMFVPRVAVAGPVDLRVGVYDPVSGARLRLRGDGDAARAYRVGALDIRPDPEAAFVAFVDGWHNAERSEQLGREWRWSKRVGRIAFRNPKAASELWLELDQPLAGVASPQPVQLVHSGTVLDAFTLEGQAITIHRTPLEREALGAADTVELELVAGQSFVPAETPSLGNADRRELGVRVFNLYLSVAR
jgi:hypothetical protein